MNVACLNVNDGGGGGGRRRRGRIVGVYRREDSAALVGAKILTFGLVEVGPSARPEIPDTDSPNWDSGRGSIGWLRGCGLTAAYSPDHVTHPSLLPLVIASLVNK